MYALTIVNAIFLGFALNGAVSPWLNVAAPAFLAVAALARAWVWLRRRDEQPSPDAIRSYLKGTFVAATVQSIAFGAWGLLLFEQVDMLGRTSIALYTFIGVVSCSYCLQSLPRAGRLVVICGTMPITVRLLFSGSWFLGGLGMDLVFIAILLMRMLADNHKGFIEVVISRADMAAEQARARTAEQHAHRLAYHDPLTGLPNRRALEEGLHAVLADETCEPRGSLLIVDLDRFKAINDVHGHAAGDHLLREVAKRLSICVGADGETYRLGGDEFAIVLRLTASGHDFTCEIAQKVVGAVAEPFQTEELVHYIGASVGIALFPQDGQARETLMRRADVALYKAKQLGRSQYCAFEPAMDAEIRRRLVLEGELREDLAAARFVPHYQPIVDLASGRIMGFELLARWARADSADVGPDQFIPIAEECGLTTQLMLTLLEQACTDARAWDPSLTLAINISPAQLKERGLSERLLDVLHRLEFPPQRLEVEITEDALIVDEIGARSTIEALKRRGIRVALDDFGTGYSSIQHLRMIRIDKIKIDRSFVQAMARDAEAMRIIRAIIGLASSLGLPVTAEGIEDLQAAAFLQSLGCNQGQGYLFGRPMPKDEIDDLLSSAFGHALPTTGKRAAA
jgi:diguanylate cyclase (GGDEF)-like protein